MYPLAEAEYPQVPNVDRLDGLPPQLKESENLTSTTTSVLITGGAGFIGSNLVRFFNEKHPSVSVRVLDDLSTGRLQNLDGRAVEFTEGSILDQDVLQTSVDGVDAVVHLAAIGSVPRSVAAPRPSHDANITGTLNVLEAARHARVRGVTVASSSAVYGSNPRLPKVETDWTRPLSPYGVTKLATESYAIAYNRSYGMSNLALRFFNVYGPLQPADHAYAAVIPRFIDAMLAGRPLTVHGDGMQSRDFTFVDTVCAVLARAAIEAITSDDPVNLAFGTNTTLMDVVERLTKISGVEVVLDHVDSRTGDVRASQGDPTRMKQLFPDIEPVAIDVGLARTLEWFRSKGV